MILRYLIVVVLLLSTASHAREEQAYVDFSFKINSHSLRSSKIDVSGFLTANRNLLYTAIDFIFNGVILTTSPLQSITPREYNDLFVGENLVFKMPMLITDIHNNFINVSVRSIDTKLNHSITKYSYRLTLPTNSIVEMKQTK